MKNTILLLAAAILIFSACTKTKTTTITKTNYDTIYQYTRNLWVNADGSGMTLSFSSDSITEYLPSFSSEPFSSYYSSLSNDTISIPSKSVKIFLTVTADSLIYNDLSSSVTTRFYRN